MTFIQIFVLVVTIYVINAGTLYDQLSALDATIFLNLVDEDAASRQLKTGGPFTLLVPTNAAFAKIPAENLDIVNNSHYTLTKFVDLHMASGLHLADDFLFGRHYSINTIGGRSLSVYNSATGLYFNQAKAVKTDVNATNGVIHLINTVLGVPEGTVVYILQNQDYNVSKFSELIKEAGLYSNFDNPVGFHRYTMFAPSNAALDALPQAKLDVLYKDIQHLRFLIEYHVHTGTLHAAALSKRHYITTTLQNHSINITTNAVGDIVLNGLAKVMLPDIEGENGIVHVISDVLFPQILSSIGDVVG